MNEKAANEQRKVWKAFRKAGELFLKTTLPESVAAYKQNVKKWRVAQTFFQVHYACDIFSLRIFHQIIRGGLKSHFYL